MGSSWNLSAVETYLVSEVHHGKPGLSSRKKQALAQDLAEEALRWIPLLAQSPVSGAREVASLLIAPRWLDDPSLTGLVWALAEDPDWEVREWAVYPFHVRYESGPESAFVLYRSWALQATPGVKRAIAVAVKGLAHAGKVAVGPLLELVEALIPEEDEYVRKNLGPFCLGDGLLPLYPEETLERMAWWAERPEWAARWNVAMSFTAKRARQFGESGMALLMPLTQDADGRVRKAAFRAKKVLDLHSESSTLLRNGER